MTGPKQWSYSGKAVFFTFSNGTLASMCQLGTSEGRFRNVSSKPREIIAVFLENIATVVPPVVNTEHYSLSHMHFFPVFTFLKVF